MNHCLSLPELQQIEFDILKTFSDFCKENSFQYYLSGGTLLGAVRHKGFIPWDDDIDVIMPRDDYNAFLKLFSVCQPAHLRLVVNEFDTIARVMDDRTIAKLNAFKARDDIGLWIDIFPMDGMPESKLGQKLHYLRIRLLRDCLYYLTTTSNIKRRSKLLTAAQYLALPIKPLLRLIGPKRLAIYINKVAAKYKLENSTYCAAITAGYGLSEINVRKDFEVPIWVEFNKTMFQTTAAYHIYLSQLYGDYMQLPPEDKRNKHYMQAWWKDDFMQSIATNPQKGLSLQSVKDIGM